MARALVTSFCPHRSPHAEIGRDNSAWTQASRSHFCMKLFFAAPESFLPSALTAFGLHASRLHFFRKHQPPVRKRLKSRRFSSARRSRSTFRAKRTGNCTWLMPDGTMRRSFSRTAAGKLAGGGRGGSYPLRRGSDDPPSKTRTPPPAPPWFFQLWVRLTCTEPCIFRPRFSGRVTRNGAPPLCVTGPP
jgi:hypothetical protein